MIKSVVRVRPELKVLITSATLDEQKFSRYFNNAPVIKIPGRTFPVEIIHVNNPEPDCENACASTVMSIHRCPADGMNNRLSRRCLCCRAFNGCSIQTEPLYNILGDILVFLEGQDEIEKCCDLITIKDHLNELWLLPFYASLPMEEQNTVFSPCPPGYKRKVHFS